MELPKQEPQDFRAEVVLPNGSFARINRHATAADMVAAFQPDGNPVRWIMMLASRIVTIDDKPITFKELEGMEWMNVAPINQMVSVYCTKIGPMLKGIG